MKIEINKIEISEDLIDVAYNLKTKVSQIEPYGGCGDVQRAVRDRILGTLTELYIEKFGAEILASIDPKVVANLIAVNSARSIRSNN